MWHDIYVKMMLFTIVNIKFLSFPQKLTLMLTKFPKNDKLILRIWIIILKLSY
jgi:hypothetical protein